METRRTFHFSMFKGWWAFRYIHWVSTSAWVFAGCHGALLALLISRCAQKCWFLWRNGFKVFALSHRWPPFVMTPQGHRTLLSLQALIASERGVWFYHAVFVEQFQCELFFFPTAAADLVVLLVLQTVSRAAVCCYSQSYRCHWSTVNESSLKLKGLWTSL